MNEIDDVIEKLSGAYVVCDKNQAVCIDSLIKMARILKGQFREQIELLKRSSDEIIKEIIP